VECVKCGRTFERPAVRGRIPRYCSKGCRRAREYELRRLQAAVGNAEERIVDARQRVDGVGGGGSPDYWRTVRRWWSKELDRLEERLRVLLDDDAEDEGPR
jgi:hypothetical protein